MKVPVRYWKIKTNPLTRDESALIHKEATVHKQIGRRFETRGEREGAQYYFGIAEGMDDTANQYREHFKPGKGGRKNPVVTQGGKKYRVPQHLVEPPFTGEGYARLMRHAKSKTRRGEDEILRMADDLGRRTREAKNNPPRATLIYSRVISIKASKAGMKHKCDPRCKAANHVYRHVHIKQSSLWGLPNGDFMVVENK